MRTFSTRTLVPVVGLFALVWGGVSAGHVHAANATPTAVVAKPVALLVDFKVRAQGLSPSAATTQAAQLAHFKLKLVSTAGVPRGIALQQILVQPRGGAYSPLVTFYYAPAANRYGFRFTEQLLGKSLPDHTGQATKVGKTTVYVTTSYSYVNILWSDAKMQYSLNNVTTKSADIDLKGLLGVVAKIG